MQARVISNVIELVAVGVAMIVPDVIPSATIFRVFVPMRLRSWVLIFRAGPPTIVAHEMILSIPLLES